MEIQFLSLDVKFLLLLFFNLLFDRIWIQWIIVFLKDNYVTYNGYINGLSFYYCYYYY